MQNTPSPPYSLLVFIFALLPPWVPKLTVLICLAREQPKGRQILSQTSSSIRSLLCPIPPEMGVTPGQTEYWMVNVYFHIKNNLWSMCVFYNNTIVCITLQNDTFYYWLVPCNFVWRLRVVSSLIRIEKNIRKFSIWKRHSLKENIKGLAKRRVLHEKPKKFGLLFLHFRHWAIKIHVLRLRLSPLTTTWSK